jgi:hypothetical protein
MSLIPRKDKDILRELGRDIAKIAADPINDKRKKRHLNIINLKSTRPTVTIFQEPWHELNDKGELDLKCEDNFCRSIEEEMRKTIYKWRHYPGDMTVEAVSNQPYWIEDSGFGICEDVDIEKVDEDNDVVSRHFNIQIKDEEDIKKLKDPVIKFNKSKTEELFEKRSEILGDILEVKKQGIGSFWFAPWDEVVRWTGIQEILMDLALRPDYVHKLMNRLVECWISRAKQLEELGALEMPLNEMEVAGAAQIFSEVSPEMHGEFALQHESKFYKLVKKVHYGCCEPLHNKVDVCAKYLPNMYQISMSPWANYEIGAKNVSNRFIFGWRPNPAHLAYEQWDENLIRNYIMEKLPITKQNGCSVAIYLKDISTVAHDPSRLTKWNQIMKECLDEVYGEE